MFQSHGSSAASSPYQNHSLDDRNSTAQMMDSDPSSANKENGKSSYLDKAQARFNTDKITKENSSHSSSIYKNNSNLNGRFEYSHHDHMSSSRHNDARYSSPSHPTDVTSTISKSTKQRKRNKKATDQQ